MNPPSPRQDDLSQARSSVLLGRLFAQLQRLEREPRAYGEGGPLTPSEIHTIDAIGDGLLMGELAASLGITKGAASQMVGRLERKGLARREPYPEDARAVFVSLRPRGRSAFEAHARLHREFYSTLTKRLDAAGINVLEQALSELTKLLSE